MADLESWDIAGFGNDSDWTDVENGDIEPFSWDEAGDIMDGATEAVVSYLDSDGETHYYTIYDYEWDIETLDAIFDDLEDKYGLD